MIETGNNYPRIIAGIGITAAALLLIFKGNVTEAMILLVAELSFFVGEKNGAKTATEKTA